jgi:DNA-binding LacI/PurR family transcriptional regulator
MPTIRDIARKAGVSTTVVSYVINRGPRPVAPETEARVRQVMELLNYHPNARAQQLARQRSDCIGLVFNGLSNSNFDSIYFSEYIRGIGFYAEQAGYNVMLFLNRESNFYQRVGKMGLVDGAILSGSSLPAEGLAHLSELAFPAVVIGRRIPNLAWVIQDYEGATFQAASHLLAQGYRRIGFLGQSLSLSYGQDRLNGYRRAHAEAGLEVDPALVSVPDMPREAPTIDDVGALVEASTDSILTDKEVIVAELLRQLGITVPEQAALVGLDEDPSGSPRLAMTTTRVPKFDMGMAAAEILIGLITKRPDIDRHRVLPMQLIIGDSSPQRQQSRM